MGKNKAVKFYDIKPTGREELSLLILRTKALQAKQRAGSEGKEPCTDNKINVHHQPHFSPIERSKLAKHEY